MWASPDLLRAPPLVVVDSIEDHWLLFVALAFEDELSRPTPSATEYATHDDAPVVPKGSSELPARLDDQERADMNAARTLDGAGHDDLSPLANVHGSRLRARNGGPSARVQSQRPLYPPSKFEMSTFDVNRPLVHSG